ncbi:MAG: hypothetical protein OEY56_02320, partial [Cyclobacteriaceae bacterium]|nr:hypothetical protein [Cyclobacteriaceae bacterium]
MKYIIFAYLFLGVLVTSLAQEGDYFLTNYSPKISNIDHSYFDLDFTSYDELIIAHRLGIIRFDGTDWELVTTPSAALTVCADANDDIYTGLTSDFGKLTILDGAYAYQSLAGESLTGLTFQTMAWGEGVFFLQESRLIHYYPTSDSLTVFYPATEDVFFDLMFEFNGQIYVQAPGALYVVDDSLRLVKSLLPTAGEILSCTKNPYQDEYALATSDGRFFVYNGRFSELKLNENVVVSELNWSSENLLAIGTISSGILVYNVRNKTIEGKINANTGLSDNEILAISSDHDRGIWVANTFGLSRIAPLVPVKNYNYYPGLKGNLIAVKTLKGKQYIATSAGLFYFDQKERYKNTVYYEQVKKTTSVPKTTTLKPEPPPAQTTQPVTTTRSSGIRSWFSSKKNETATDAQKTDQQSSSGLFKSNQSSTSKKTSLFNRDNGQSNSLLPKKKSAKEEISYVRKVRRNLISIDFLYQSIEGLDEKCRFILPIQDRLVASTSSGIVEIQNGQATQIYGEPVRYIYHPPGSKLLIVSRSDGGVRVLELDDNLWMEIASLEIPGEIILSAYSDANKDIWLAGTKSLFKTRLKDSVLVVSNKYELNNQFFDNIRLTELSGSLFLVNTQGYYMLDPLNNALVEVREISNKIGLPKKHLIQNDGKVWVNNGVDWYRIESATEVKKYTYLKLFPEMTYIDQVGTNFWIIDQFSKLYKYTPGIQDSISEGKMFIREVRSKNKVLPTSSKITRIQYDNNSLHVEMARP